MGFFDDIGGNLLDLGLTDELGLGGLFGGGDDAAGASGLNSPFLKDFLSEYKKAREEAKALNLERYNEVKTNWLNLIRDTKIHQKTLGDAAKRDINQGAYQQINNTKAALSQRGLSATTVPSSIESGIMRQRHDAIGTLNENLRRERIGTEIGLTSQLNNTISSVANPYPDSMSSLAPFLMQAGQNQGYGAQQGGLGGLFNSLGPIIQTLGPLLPLLI